MLCWAVCTWFYIYSSSVSPLTPTPRALWTLCVRASSLPLSTSQPAFLHLKLLFQHLMPSVLSICNVISSVIIPNPNLKSQWTIKQSRIVFLSLQKFNLPVVKSHAGSEPTVTFPFHSKIRPFLRGQTKLGVEAVTQLMDCTDWAWWCWKSLQFKVIVSYTEFAASLGHMRPSL